MVSKRQTNRRVFLKGKSAVQAIADAADALAAANHYLVTARGSEGYLLHYCRRRNGYCQFEIFLNAGQYAGWREQQSTGVGPAVDGPRSTTFDLSRNEQAQRDQSHRDRTVSAWSSRGCSLSSNRPSGIEPSHHARRIRRCFGQPAALAAGFVVSSGALARRGFAGGCRNERVGNSRHTCTNSNRKNRQFTSADRASKSIWGASAKVMRSIDAPNSSLRPASATCCCMAATAACFVHRACVADQTDAPEQADALRRAVGPSDCAIRYRPDRRSARIRLRTRRAQHVGLRHPILSARRSALRPHHRSAIWLAGRRRTVGHRPLRAEPPPRPTRSRPRCMSWAPSGQSSSAARIPRSPASCCALALGMQRPRSTPSDWPMGNSSWCNAKRRRAIAVPIGGVPVRR